MASGIPQDEVNKLVSTIQTLKNKDLARICYENYLTKSGNKADLQRRIIALIDSAVHDPNPQKFTNIKNSILRLNGGSTTAAQIPAYTNNGYANGAMSSPYNGSTASASTPTAPVKTQTHTPARGVDLSTVEGFVVINKVLNYIHQGLHFKPSPFFDIDTPLSDVRLCEAMAQHRNTINIQLRSADLQRIQTDPVLRVLVLCASGKTGKQDVAFPYQCEIKLNGGDIKANTRGLKNKPGSTRPVDITDQLRLKPPHYQNSLEFSYALTTKRFYLAVYLCKTYSVSDLTFRIGRRARITKASVIKEITTQAQDPDIVATSTVLSLKCPLTYMRLTMPIRATTCKHLQCFDATSYLQLQEQGPQWLCPVCNNSASFESLAVDEYVKDILDKTPSDLEQVTIEPDGEWHVGKAKFDTAPTTPGVDVSDSEIVLATPGTGIDSRDTTATPHTTMTPQNARTPGVPATSSNAVPVGSRKRSHTEVIDLTLSDSDDDDEPPRKQQQLQAPPPNISTGGEVDTSASYMRTPPSYRGPVPR